MPKPTRQPNAANVYINNVHQHGQDTQHTHTRTQHADLQYT